MKHFIFSFILLSVVCGGGVFAQQVEELSTDYVDTVGTQKKLSFVRWGTYPEKSLEQAFIAFSKSALSPVTRDILVRVLSEKTSLGRHAENEGVWLDLRLKMLKNAGAKETLAKMLPYLPPKKADEIRSDVLFSNGDWEGSCAFIKNQSDADEEKLFCTALKGSKEEAELLYELAMEKDELSPTSVALIKGLLEKAPKPADFSESSLSSVQQFVAEHLGWILPPPKAEVPIYTPFGRAIHLKKMQKLWEKESPDRQNYRWTVLMTYVSLFRPDIQFTGMKDFVLPDASMGKINPLSVKLKDRPEGNITGKDVLTALLFLDGQTVNLYEAFLLLQKSGVNVEQWVLEQINP